MEKIDIIGAVFGDTSFIAYRPDLRKITPSIAATILLQQIVYRWKKNGNEKFYKFREPCEHERYHPGDSWTEELGFSGKEFDSALRSIGFKLGKTKNEIEKKDAFIVYYRDNEGLTWYSLNEELLSSSLLGNYQGVAQRGSTKVIDQRGSTNPYTKITTEITTEIDVANAPFPSYKGTLTGTGELGTNKPRTPREFANARRAELGKPPLQPNRTEKQDLAVQALKLIDYFKQTFYEKHGEGVDAYFGGDPEENGKYTKLAKACILLLGKDSERYVEEWIGGLGEFFQYDPSNCWSSSQMRKWKVSQKLKNKDSEIKPEYI